MVFISRCKSKIIFWLISLKRRIPLKSRISFAIQKPQKPIFNSFEKSRQNYYKKCFESNQNNAKIIWKSIKFIIQLKKTLHLLCLEQFCSFDVCSARPLEIFQVQAKISTIRPVFPDYLSVSYDDVLN